MKSTIATFAEYNRHADQLLHAILDDADPALIPRPAGAYFRSILGLLNHILVSDLTWLSRFRDGGVPARALSDPGLIFEHPGFGVDLYDDYGHVKDHQGVVDRVLEKFVQEIDAMRATAEDPGPAFTYTNSKGETHRFAISGILLHLFNHATHHRGQISQILDENGVDHDFSNLFAVLEEEPEQGV